MKEPADRSGWLPMEARDALEDEKDRASADEADRLLALDPRARVVALLERLRPEPDDATPPLRPADLARLIESFPGDRRLDPAWLAERFPPPPTA